MDTAMDTGMDTGEMAKEEHVLNTLWHHDNCKLVAQVSLRYFEFFKAHLQFLVHKTRKLERRRLDEVMEAMIDTGEQSLENNARLSDTAETMMETGEGSEDGGEESTDPPPPPLSPPPLQEEVKWVSVHWVELARTGEQLRETCVSVLTENANPFKNHPDELTCSMKLPLPPESIWTVLLDRIVAAAACNKHNYEKSLK